MTTIKKDKRWTITDAYGIGKLASSPTEKKVKIAAFDLDYTLIKPKSGKKFPQDKDDWQKMFPNIIKRLSHFAKDHFLVIFTNQKVSKTKLHKREDIPAKITAIHKKWKIDFWALMAFQDDRYRKPHIGMWELLEKELGDTVKIDKKKSFYCGDAIGRKGDFSASDRLLAHNVGINFYSPEEIFLEEKGKWKKQVTDKFNPSDYLVTALKKVAYLPQDKKQEIVLLVGYPGSGKTYLAQNHFPKYTWINQDTLRTTTRCQRKAEDALDKGKSVIIDCTNTTREKRKVYLEMGEDYGLSVRCFWLDYPIELAWHLNNVRVALGEKDKIPVVAYRTFRKYFEKPEKKEGFQEVVTLFPQFKLSGDKKKYFLFQYGEMK